MTSSSKATATLNFPKDKASYKAPSINSRKIENYNCVYALNGYKIGAKQIAYYKYMSFRRFGENTGIFKEGYSVNIQLIIFQLDRYFVSLQITPDGPITGYFGGKIFKLHREDTQNFRNSAHFANDRVRFYGKVS